MRTRHVLFFSPLSGRSTRTGSARICHESESTRLPACARPFVPRVVVTTVTECRCVCDVSHSRHVVVSHGRIAATEAQVLGKL